MRLLIGTLFALAVAAFVGLGLTYYALSRGAAFGALSIDSWDAFPKTGTVEADPYARASIARSGRLPIALGDGVSFTVQEDDDGKAARRALRCRALRHHAGGALLDADAV